MAELTDFSLPAAVKNYPLMGEIRIDLVAVILWTTTVVPDCQQKNIKGS
jgi:hypothetical protein